MLRRLFLVVPPILVGLLLLSWVTLAPPSGQRLNSPNRYAYPTPLELDDLPTAVTDAEGRFIFPSVSLATHQVYLVESTLPDRWQADLPATPVRLTLNPGMASSGRVTPWVVLRARYQDEAIAGAVFADLDGDGQMSAGDVGLAGVTVVDPGMHQYFVPFDDDDLQAMFADINESADCYAFPGGSTSNLLDSIISLTASTDGTIWYYDHWEDGYDLDPEVPGATTTSGTLDAGESVVWRDQVITPRDPNPECEPGRYCYDGRDRITLVSEVDCVIEAGSVIRAAWPVAPGSLLAGAWEVWEVAQWGNSYVVPIGEDLGSGEPNPPDGHDFDWVGLQVMGTDSTTITIDRDGDGVGDVTETLAPGQSYAVIGDASAAGVGIDSGATVTADGPVQVQMLTGACGSPYAARAYTLIPRDEWRNDYYSPVPSLRDSQDFPGFGTCPMGTNPFGVETQQTSDVVYYIHNPNPSPIDVTWETVGASDVINDIQPNTTFVLGPGPGPGPDPLPLNAPVRLTSTDNFWALAAVDSALSYGASQDFDWGFAVLPMSRLSSQVVLGWSTGHDTANVPPDGDNGNLAFVTPIDDTTIYVDLDADGTADNFDSDGSGALENPNAYGIDETTSANGIFIPRLGVLRVSDHMDNDLNGALIYSPDLADHLAVAWGQDGCQAGTGTGYLDLGYTVLPVTIPVIEKECELAVDADGSGGVSPGDTLVFTITVGNNGFGAMFNVVLTDTLPHEYVDLVLGSIETTLPYMDPPGVVYDDGSGTFSYVPPGAPDMADATATAFRLTWSTMAGRTTITVTFHVVVHDLPPEGFEICNSAVLTSDDTSPVEADGCCPIVRSPMPVVEKACELAEDADGSGEVSPGDTLAFTITMRNDGLGAMSNAVLTDTLSHEYVDYLLGSIETTLPYMDPPGIEYDDGSGAFSYVPPGAPGTADATVTAFRLTWATLGPQSAITVTFRVVVHDLPPGLSEICNSAVVSSDETGSVEADGCCPIVPPPIPVIEKACALAEDADGSEDVSPGDTLAFSITVRNDGLGAMSNVVLTDTFSHEYVDLILGSIEVALPSVDPPGIAYDDGSGAFSYVPTGAPGTADAAITAFRLTWAAMAARSAITVTFRVVVHDLPPGGSDICNSAAVSSDETGPVEADGCCQIVPPPIPVIEKACELAEDADGSEDVSPGDTLSFPITIRNDGFGAMSNVVLADDLPSEYVDLILGSIVTSLPSMDPPGVEYDDGSGTFSYVPSGTPGTTDATVTAFRLTWAAMAPRSTTTVTFRVVVHDVPSDGSAICSSAVMISDETSPVEADGCCLVFPLPTPDIDKACELAADADGSGDVSRGDTLSFAIALANAGSGPMSNVVLTDDLPHERVDLILGGIETSRPVMDPPGIAYDDGSGTFSYVPAGAPGTADEAITAFRLTWATMAARSTISVTVHAVVHDVPHDRFEICNFAVASSDETGPVEDDGCCPGQPPTIIFEIPEPLTLVLMLGGLTALAGCARLWRRK